MLFSTLSALVLAATASAHIVISYPGWRGNNLITNETFPYGMQWSYPCGGMGVTKNRTYWPTSGGTVAFQPGWFQGHASAFMYVNMGFGTDGPDGGPANMSNPMVPVFQILGPSKNPFPGTVCLTQIPLPVNTTVKPGDHATIQIVELAMHGAALYSCVDIEFAEPGDPKIEKVNETNCFNSVDIGMADVYTITTRASGQTIEQAAATSDAEQTVTFWYAGKRPQSAWAVFSWVPFVLGGLWIML
nr:protein-like protein 2 [Colletotrichum truncatum]KAF6781394.1 protein-like protein 2 [Colletotrichum truncatum]